MRLHNEEPSPGIGIACTRVLKERKQHDAAGMGSKRDVVGQGIPGAYMILLGRWHLSIHADWWRARISKKYSH